MQPELALPAAFLVAALVAWLATPVAIRVALATRFVDRPVGYKGHAQPTPYLGGSAIMAGVLVAAVAFGGATGPFAVLLACVACLLVLGTVDDRLNLSPHLRLAVEAGIGALLFATGHGWEVFGSTALDLALTCAWVVGIVNAVNLMDNMDGAAAAVAGSSAAGTGVLAAVSGEATLAALCFAVAGACAGFLPRNLARPSRIFMGDGGSMPLGLLLAGTTMAVAADTSLGAAGLPAAAMLVGLVILDTTLVTISRRRGGRGLLTGGRDHLTHRLRGQLSSAGSVAALLAAAQCALCAAAVLLSLGDPVMLAATAVGFVALGARVIWLLESPPWFHQPAASPHVFDAVTQRPEPATAPAGGG